MDSIWLLIKVTAPAGIGGTGLGGVIGALFKRDSVRTVSLLLSFAGGVMASIVCFDLIVSAIDTKINIYLISLGIAFGVFMVYLLNLFIDNTTNKEVQHIDKNHPATADDLDEIIHSNHLSEHLKKNDTKLSLFIAGVIMASAIALHNVPEGMTIGASFANNEGLMEGSALILAILIGLHNIPEGMAIAVPLINGGLKRRKAIFITALSGTPTIIGALAGYFLGDMGDLGLSMSLSFASGAMLYVIFGELLPQSILMYRSKLPAFFVIFGMLTGLIIINI
ncbi:MAG: ZIP family metal transporter [Candidatus Gastranaerophilales bacterium]|nr:ZIP family metal transporter [Candidatus Gastranaerophilales bacterium]